MALDELKNTIDKLREFSFHDELVNIVDENKETIADLQAKQLAQGIKSDGTEINPPYSPEYAEYKRKYGVGLGRTTDHVTFYLTGDLYSKLEMVRSGDEYDIQSSSFKFDLMKKRSGEKVVGLNQASREEFAEEITLPNIKKVFKDKTGLSF